MFVYGKSPGGIGTGTDHHSAHFLYQNRLLVEFQMGNVQHEPYDVHFLSEKSDQLLIFNERMDGYRFWYKTWYKNWDNSSPGRRAGPADCLTTAMAGKLLLIHRDPHTHSCYPNDFTDPNMSSFWQKNT